MRRLGIVTASLMFWSWAALALSPTEDLFQKGLAAYQNKQYTEARDFFDQALKEGDQSPSLYHDLALTYFQLDQKAYAMAFWRKALALDPSFALARSGRNYMETKFNMRPWEKDSAAVWIRRTMESLSYYELFWLIALLIGGAGWMWIRYIAARMVALEDEQPKPPFPNIAAGLTVIWIFLMVVVAYKFQILSTPRATVVLDKVQARSLPADDGVGLFDLSGGSEVLVRRANGDWLQVQNSDGASGWVKNSEVLETSKGVSL